MLFRSDRDAEDTKLEAEATRLEELAGDYYEDDEASGQGGDEETAEFEEHEAATTEETEATV